MPAPVYFRHDSSLGFEQALDTPNPDLRHRHPESPDRIVAIERLLEMRDWLGYEVRQAPRIANVALVAERAPTGFSALRPPGHHADGTKPMGFCLFDNVAIAARHALAEHGLERVAIIDFDVHHGNGTEDIFEDDEHVLMTSIFQHPFYPYSGADNPASNMVNVPLSAGSGSKEFRAAVTKHWLPALDDFQPQFILFSAGFDAHVEDDMAMLRFTDADYGWVTSQMRDVAERHARGRMVSMLESGYALSALGRSVVQHMRVLAGID